MCCIFTCCGWVIDLVQRFWVFTMSCCISGAVTCTLVTASMSGIAMGYNYSLAEYIDLKETNVSVYLKRGVFDDDIADDMEWRRAGHLPVKGFLNEDNLETGAPMDYASTSVPYGRRMDESIFESDDHHKFEGSLMKLTAKPVYGSRTPNIYTSESVNPNEEPSKPGLGPDELKEMQALINRRKFNYQKITTHKHDTPMSTMQDHDERDFPKVDDTGMFPQNSGRRQMLERMNGPGYGDSARMLVPGANIGVPENWMNPKLSKDQLPTRDETYLLPEVVTYPRPMTLRQGPLRPSRPPPPKTYPTHTTSPAARYEDENSMLNKKMAEYKNKFDEDFRANQESSEEQDDVVQKFKKKKGGSIGIGEEYDDEFKGLPVRRRRRHNFAIEKKSSSNKSETDFHNKVDNMLQSYLLTKLMNVTEDTTIMEAVSQNDIESRNEIDGKDTVFHKIKDLLNRFSRKPLSKQPCKLSEILGLQVVADSYTMSAVF